MKVLFDMDGTIADLYGQPNWLKDLEATNSRPYEKAQPMVDMVRLAKVCGDLINKGHEIEIVSWLAKNSTKEYNKATRQAKRNWLKENNFKATKIHLVKYGTPKARYMNGGDLNVLFDDNEQVRGDFEKHKNCIAFNPNEYNICELLERVAATN